MQTEDSGRKHPHVITHLYHGGTILASEKSSYAELLGESDLVGTVRSLMERQHEAMLTRLRAGDLDELLAERLGAEVFSASKPEGASGHTQRTAAPEPAPAPAPASPTQRAKGPAADRPLDELILDYLVDSTRRARRPAAPGAGRAGSASSRKLE